MQRGEFPYVRHAVGHLAADGVSVFERGIGRDVVLYVFHYGAETVQGLCRLAVQADVSVHVQSANFLRTLYHDGRAFCLAYKPKNLGMTVFAEDDNLLLVLRVCRVFLADTFLQVQDNGTCGIHDMDIVLLRLFVGGGRFAMGAEQDVGVAQGVVCVVVYGLQAKLLQTAAFLAVVHDVPQAVEFLSIAQFFFCLSYGSGHSEAEATSFVNFNNHSCCSAIVMLLLSRTIASSAWVRGDISRCESI